MEYIYLNPKVNCAEVSSIYKDTNFNTLPVYSVGRYNCNLTRLLINFDLSNVSRRLKVLEANINFKLNNNIIWGNFVNAYETTEPWEYKSVTWNSKVSFDTYKTIFTIKDPHELVYKFNITSLVEKWIDNGALNNGLILIANECSIGKTLIDGNSICLEIKCVIDEECKDNGFHENFQEVSFRSTNFFTKSINTSNFKIVTYFVKNIGSENVKVRTQISPNKIDFVTENNNYMIKTGEIKTLTPYMFSKFIRLLCESDNNNEKRLEVWFQAQD